MPTPLELIEREPSPEDLKFLEDRLYEFNAAQTGRDDGWLFSFFLHSEGEVVGGLAGWTWAQACEVLTLWVHPDWRGQGHGRALLEAAEQKARQSGCRIILVRSYSFQAPDFYRKFGYELAWQLDGFPPGSSQAFLIKRLEQSSSLA